MKSTFLLVVITLSIGFISGNAPVTQAQQTEESGMTIGYVDPQTILMSMPDMAAIERRLQNFAEQRREEFAEKENRFRQEVEEYQQKMGVISEEAQQQEEERLAELNMELQEFSQNFQMEYQERQMELMEPLFDQIQDAIDDVATERGFTYVLNTMTERGDFVILYASEEAQNNYDITNEVKRTLEID